MAGLKYQECPEAILDYHKPSCVHFVICLGLRKPSFHFHPQEKCLLEVFTQCGSLHRTATCLSSCCVCACIRLPPKDRAIKAVSVYMRIYWENAFLW